MKTLRLLPFLLLTGCASFIQPGKQHKVAILPGPGAEELLLHARKIPDVHAIITNKPPLGYVRWSLHDSENTAVISDGKNVEIYNREGVYVFLEEFLGYRWWTPEASTIPKRLQLPEKSLYFIPPFAFRSIYWGHTQDSKWQARNHLQAHPPNFAHTFYSLIPPSRYFKTHPDWFSEIDGTRRSEKAQLCLTNSDLAKEMVRSVKKKLSDHPSIKIISLSQNDHFGYCQCKRCRKLNELEGSPSGSLIHFVNAVAYEIEKKYPEVLLSTLAYQYTFFPPRFARARDNVLVLICPIQADFGRPFDGVVLESIKIWRETARHCYLWDYATNFRHYLLPHPNYNAIAPNIKQMATLGVEGIFSLGAYNSPVAEFSEMRAWVTAKLLWNPYQDPEALYAEFARGYYQKAAPKILKYLTLLQEHFQEKNITLGCFMPGISSYLDYPYLSKGWPLLQAAERAVSNKPFLRKRVRKEQLSVLYAVLMNWNRLRKEAGKKWIFMQGADEQLIDFLARADEAGAVRVNEWLDGFDPLRKRVEASQKAD